MKEHATNLLWWIVTIAAMCGGALAVLVFVGLALEPAARLWGALRREGRR